MALLGSITSKPHLAYSNIHADPERFCIYNNITIKVIFIVWLKDIQTCQNNWDYAGSQQWSLGMFLKLNDREGTIMAQLHNLHI